MGSPEAAPILLQTVNRSDWVLGSLGAARWSCILAMEFRDSL